MPASNDATHTIDPIQTFLQILPGANPTVVGQPYQVTWTTAPPPLLTYYPELATGVVTASDGIDSCSTPLADNGCTFTSSTPGARTIVLSYPGDGNFTAPLDTYLAHQTDPASTVTAITGVAPAVTTPGQPYTVGWSVSVVAPGGGTPTGTVAVTDGTDSCSAPVAVRSCVLTSTTSGNKTVVVRYLPDTANYTTSAGATIHTVAPLFITSVTPSARVVGSIHQVFDIGGGGFVNGSLVTLSGSGISAATTSFVSSTHLVFTASIAAGAVTGPRDVVVTNPGGLHATCTGCLTLDPRPTLISAAPGALPQGLTGAVTLTGTGFLPGATVAFGPGVTVNGAPTVSTGGTTILADVTVAANAGVGSRMVSVTNPDGGVVAKNVFRVNPAPSISNITPPALAQGAIANVVVMGSNFTAPAPSLVSFGPGVVVNTVTRNSAGKLTVNVTVDPAAALGARDLTVTNPDGGTTTRLAALTVDAPPFVTPPLLPNAVAIGSSNRSIVVHGSGFRAGANTSVAGGVRVNSTRFDSATQLTLLVSAPTATTTLGAHDLVVTNIDGGVATCRGLLYGESAADDRVGLAGHGRARDGERCGHDFRERLPAATQRVAVGDWREPDERDRRQPDHDHLHDQRAGDGGHDESHAHGDELGRRHCRQVRRDQRPLTASERHCSVSARLNRAAAGMLMV